MRNERMEEVSRGGNKRDIYRGYKGNSSIIHFTLYREDDVVCAFTPEKNEQYVSHQKKHKTQNTKWILNNRATKGREKKKQCTFLTSIPRLQKTVAHIAGTYLPIGVWERPLRISIESKLKLSLYHLYPSLPTSAPAPAPRLTSRPAVRH